MNPPRRVRRQAIARHRPDTRYSSIRVDNNFFDLSLPDLELAAADSLLEIAEAGHISICTPHSVRRELDDPRTPQETRERASRLPYTLDTGMGNQQRLNLVKRIMRGNASDGRHDADATHLYDAALWHATYFVTCDRRVLKKQEEILSALSNLWIVRPSELLAHYRSDDLTDME